MPHSRPRLSCQSRRVRMDEDDLFHPLDDPDGRPVDLYRMCLQLLKDHPPNTPPVPWHVHASPSEGVYQ